VKKWLKNGIYGTREQYIIYYSQLTWSNSAAGKKKKRERKRSFSVPWVPASSKRKCYSENVGLS